MSEITEQAQQSGKRIVEWVKKNPVAALAIVAVVVLLFLFLRSRGATSGGAYAAEPEAESAGEFGEEEFEPVDWGDLGLEDLELPPVGGDGYDQTTMYDLFGPTADQYFEPASLVLKGKPPDPGGGTKDDEKPPAPKAPPKEEPKQPPPQKKQPPPEPKPK